MIGSAFSIFIRMELAAPGVQFLEGDHQLFNVIITAHALIMSTLSHCIEPDELSLLGTNHYVMGKSLARMLIWKYISIIGEEISIKQELGFLHISPLSALVEPNKTISGVVGHSFFCAPIIMQIGSNWWGVVLENWRLGTWYVLRGWKGTAGTMHICWSVLSWSNWLIYFVITSMKTISGIINGYCNPLAKASSTEETTSAQAISQDTQESTPALDPKGDDDKEDSNSDDTGIQDSTASSPLRPKGTRTRSRHSSISRDTKGDSVKTQTTPKEILPQRPKKPLLHKVLVESLAKYLDKNNKYNGIIRLMDSDFLKVCYSLIKSNPGNMTPGSNSETLDRISDKWFTKTAKDMLEGRYKFTPARQMLIPKPNKPGQYQQLLIANPREKIVQKSIQTVLEAIFESTFSDSSHGFRPGRSVMTALDHIHMRGGHMSWVINGDITKCFDTIPHEIIMKQIEERVSCSRTLNLIKRSLNIGYVDQQGNYVKAVMGTPQGSILSPLLSNIVLDMLDKFMESKNKELNIGIKRKRNLKYTALENRRKYYKTRDPAIAKQALLDIRKLPRLNMHDMSFRRALYIRYADDFIILLANKLENVLLLKKQIADFLREVCGLELNQEKTTVTNTRDGFKFLGARIIRHDNASIFNSFKKAGNRKITWRSTLRMRVDAPIVDLLEKLIANGFARRNHLGTLLAKGKTNMVHLSHFDIIQFFNSKITGLLNAYSFAGNFSNITKVVWFLRQSCALTLARKFKLRTMAKTFQKFGFDLKDSQTDAKLNIPESFKATYDYGVKSYNDTGNNLEEIADKILGRSWSFKFTSALPRTCILCGTTTDIEMHHLRAVKDVRAKIRTGDTTWAQWKGAVLRKQIPLCKYHHGLLHTGNLNHNDMQIIARYKKPKSNNR